MTRTGYKGRNKVNNMVREKFEKPEMEMVTFDAEDIIVTSAACVGKDCEGYGDKWCNSDNG